MQNIIISNDLSADMKRVLEGKNTEQIFILCDENTARLCLPRLLEAAPQLKDRPVKVIGAGDAHKHIDTVVEVWRWLQEQGATRWSTMINLGGGMVTDLGGFCASTFKRGMNYVNIATTLLGAVDAAVGGKTGFNFNGLKNEIGVIRESEYVVEDTTFFCTLDRANLISGMAEMLKHALISDEQRWKELMAYDMDTFDLKALSPLLEKSINVKEQIVAEDPYEQGKRKALNFGHTFGHAFESFTHEIGRPALHGYAVAWGMVAELYLSYVTLGFPKATLLEATHLIREQYGKLEFGCKQYDHLYELMTHDKKNVQKGEINFTLLGGIGDIRIDQHVSRQLVEEAFDYYLG
ncbi:MAG: 3-dehydroquinate synthase [Paludibacteraceae bacterium]|nr:3-dehydroquinate synthase [Paludibacteraceae bacterium]